MPALKSTNILPSGRTVRGSKRRPAMKLVLREVGRVREGKMPSRAEICSDTGSMMVSPRKALARTPVA
ncbi:MAG: hypothetical protein IPF99_40840 [Deltaproteobacteria bacterium]|nr:hypothetical protein [Deltaproteobacteria bacterium]